MIDWNSPTWGGNVHTDPNGSWLDAEPVSVPEGY
jgi:hypothetical protein